MGLNLIKYWDRICISRGSFPFSHNAVQLFFSAPLKQFWLSTSNNDLSQLVSVSFYAAFCAVGAKLQGFHDDPRLASGNTELHEDAAVSFIFVFCFFKELLSLFVEENGREWIIYLVENQDDLRNNKE